MVENRFPVIPGFALSGRLGAGGAGTVYRAIDEAHNREVAIKVLTGQTIDDSIREGFTREVRTMGALSDHPNIVTLYHSGFTADSDEPYLVMPLFTNGSYADRLASHGPLPSTELIEVTSKLISALQTAHERNVLHRDIKPDNVFVGSYNNQPFLGDFGISTLMGSGRTTTKAVAYTLAYAAPEVLNGERQTVSSDIYSLGATLHAFASGTAPFAGETVTGLITQILTQHPTPLPPSVPSHVAHLLGQMMAREPHERPQSCAEALHRLQSTPISGVQAAVPAVQSPTSQPPLPPGTPAPQMLTPTQPLHENHLPKSVTGPSNSFTPSVTTKGSPKTNFVVFGAIGFFAIAALAIVGYLVLREDDNAAANAEATEATEAPRDTPVEEVKTLTFLTTITETEGIEQVSLSPDNNTILAIIDDTNIGLWDSKTGESKMIIETDNSQDDAVWATDGSTIITYGFFDEITFWNAETGVQQRELDEDFDGLDVSSDGTTFATTKSDQVELRDIESGQVIRTLTPENANQEGFESVRFSPDGTQIAAEIESNFVQVWNTADGQVRFTFEAEGSVNGFLWSPDGANLAVASSSTIEMLDPANGQVRYVIDRRSGPVAWSPDGSTLATTEDDDVVFWDAATGVQQLVLRGHERSVSDFAWSPGGSSVVTVSDDETAKLWDASTGLESQALAGPFASSEARQLAWTSDGETLILLASDNEIGIWDAS